MVYNLNNRLDDKSSLRPQEIEVLKARQKPIQIREAIRKPMDTRPNSLALFATMLNGVANIGRTVAGVMQQNNAAIAGREYDKFSTKFDQEIASLQNEDLASFPEKYDGILNRYRENIDNLEVSKSVKRQIKAMLLDNSEDRAYSLFTNTITANKNQLIESHNIRVTNAIENRDRTKVNKIIYDNSVGPNAIFNKAGAALQIAKANKAIDLGIAEDQLYKMPIEESIAALDDPDYKYNVVKQTPVLDEAGNPLMEGGTQVGAESAYSINEPGMSEDKGNSIPVETGINRIMENQTPVMEGGRSIVLSQRDRTALKKQLIDDDYRTRTAESQQYGENFEKLMEFRANGGDFDTFKTEVRDGKYPGITENNMRDTWNKSGDIFNGYTEAEQKAVFDEFYDVVIKDYDAQNNVKHPEKLKELLQKSKFSMGNDNYQKAAKLLKLPMPTGKVIDPAKEYAIAVADRLKDDLAMEKITAPEARIYAANAIKAGDIGNEEFKSVMDYAKDFENSNIKSLIKSLATSGEMNKFKDKDGNIDMAKYGMAVTALRTMIEEGAGVDSPLTVPQMNDRYNNLIAMYTDKSILKELDQVEKNVRGFGYSRFEGDSDRVIKRLVTGQLAPLRYVDPGKYEEFSTYLNEQAKIIAKKDFPGKELSDVVELHENYMPIYRIDGKKYVFDVSTNGKSVIFTPFDRALEKYKNLAYGKPVGTVFENSILTFDGYKNMADLVPVEIQGNEGYLLKKDDNTADYDSPAYVMARDGNGNKVFAPIYTPLSDTAGVLKELESITEIPKTEKELEEIRIRNIGDERYEELRRNAGPRRF